MIRDVVIAIQRLPFPYLLLTVLQSFTTIRQLLKFKDLHCKRGTALCYESCL